MMDGATDKLRRVAGFFRAHPTLELHLALSLCFLVTRFELHRRGLRFNMILDWMFMDDPSDLRDRLLEALWYGHAFPPGLNLMTGLLYKASEAQVVANAHALFQLFGLTLVNSLFYLCRAMGLTTAAGFALALVFAVLPQTIYFEHLYLYEMPVASLLALAAALFHEALRRQAAARSSFGWWLGCFLACAAIGWIRSTFHLVWFCAVAVLALVFTARGGRRQLLVALVGPAVLLVGVYLKNWVVFGTFAALTWTPGIFTTTTIQKLPSETREAWVREGKVSPFAAISMYSPPRAYLSFFDSPHDDRWPAMLNVLDKPTLGTPNYSHWFFLEINRRRAQDARVYLRERPLEYLSTVKDNTERFLSAGTHWHPRDSEPAGPHYQHRQVLGHYEAAYNRIVHGFPFAPLGLYAFAPLACMWALYRAWVLARDARQEQAAEPRAQGALLAFCLLQIGFASVTSVMFTSGESPRYRFQIEAFIVLLGTLALVAGWERLRAWRRPADGARPATPSP
jgi:4-amino-4-deoxy-L-arabinose transferase-like glycosyltransferase